MNKRNRTINKAFKSAMENLNTLRVGARKVYSKALIDKLLSSVSKKTPLSIGGW